MARLLRPAVVLLALALVIGACGGGGDAEPTPTRTARATRTATATASPSPTATASATPRPAPTSTPRPGSGGQQQPPSNDGGSAPGGRQTAGLGLPGGFSAYVVAEGFYRPTSVAVGPDGTVYVSERHGAVYRLTNGGRSRLASFSGDVTGVAVSPQGTLYVSSTGRVSTVGGNGSVRDVITGLPTGRHQNNGMAFAGGKIYVTNGSTCDDCVEGDPRSATILQANLDGSGLRVYARGLRNSYDLVFDGSGRLWATDNGSDAPCATIDEVDLIRDGGDYGWPYRPGCNPYADGIAPVANLGLHTASTGIDYYDGAQFPSAYRGNLFLTLWGSLFAAPELSPALYRVVIDGGRVERFASGFTNPIDVTLDRDGSLLMLDYGSGRLYRIAYTG